MTGTNVGSVWFDVGFNQKSFDSGIKSSAKNAEKTFGNAFASIGKMAIAAFSVKALFDFGSSAISLASDLEEVQNVVDVTFGKSSEVINQFAKDAMTAFGMSELSAKQYTGTMGAMLKSMGFTSDAVTTMSTDLVGLAGDMASFYNLSTDMAFEKIRSGISGETEPLKQLGINMSVVNLEAFAMSQGISKAYSTMTQSEQALLRYNYLLSTTSDAQGDFARTSDSWANQTRVLKLQWDSFKASLGGAFIAVLSPVVKGLNWLMSKLIQVANVFKEFIGFITGSKQGADASASAIQDIGDAAVGSADSVTDVGDAATGAGKKATKAAKGALAAFDELTNINIADPADSDSGSGGSGAGGLSDLGGVNFGKLETESTVLDSTASKFQGLIDSVKELAGLFVSGFKIGIGDLSVLDSIKTAISNIGISFKDIFSSKEVISAAGEFAKSIVTNLGKVTGSVASIGLTMADNLLGGFDTYLTQNKDLIKKNIAKMFDLSTERANIIGNFSVVLADIATVFRSPEAKQVTADIIGIFSSAGQNIGLVAMQLGNDFLRLMTEPINNNKDGIKEALSGLFQPMHQVLGTIKQGIDDTFSKFWEVYDTKIKPGIDKMSEALSKFVGTIVENWNAYVKPVLDEWGAKFTALWEEHIQPMIDGFVEMIGTAVDYLGTMWNEVLAPFFDWLMSMIMPWLMPLIEGIGNAVMIVIGVISDLLGALWDYLSGFMDFIAGVFTGDWERAWDGIKQMFGAVWDAIKGVFNGVIEWFKNGLNTLSGYFAGVWEAIKNLFGGIGTWFQARWNDIKNAFSAVGTWFGTLFSNAWTNIKASFAMVGTFFSGIWTSIKNAFGAVGDWFKNIFSNAWQAVQNVFSKGGQIFAGIKDNIASVFSSVVNNLLGGINKVIAIPFNAINGALSGLRGISILGAKPFGWLPSIGVPQIPMLAKGGIADGPTLSMIGEAGKEAVLPLENNTGWMVTLANVIADALAAKLATNNANQQQQPTGPINLTMEIDGRQTGEVLLDYVLLAAQRRGIKLPMSVQPG